jgi:SRSO17 transposase
MQNLEKFESHLEHLGEGPGHADRKAGLMAPLERKSVEPMAAHWEPAHTRARHQSLHHFVSQAAWSDNEILKRVAQWVVPTMDFSTS